MSEGSRSRSRSPSGGSSRSRSPTVANQSTSSKRSRRKYSNSQSRSDSEKSYSNDSFYSEASKKNARGNRRKPPIKTSNKRGSKGNSTTNSLRGSMDNTSRGERGPVSRIISANRLRISELRNRVVELTDQLSAVKLENRDQKRLIRRQGQKIDSYEQQEHGMPQIMQRQADETHMLREQLRRQKEKYEARSKKLKEKEEELDTMQRLIKKMRGIIDDKKLMERKKLSERLKQTEEKLNEEIERNKVLERHVQNLSRNYKHEVSSERAKEQELSRQLQQLQEKYVKLEMDLKEKEKERTLQNIYSYRALKPPYRLESSLKSGSQSDIQPSRKPRLDFREKAKSDEMKSRRNGGLEDGRGRREDQKTFKSDRKSLEISSDSREQLREDLGLRESSSSVFKIDKMENEKNSRELDPDRKNNTATEVSSRSSDSMSWLREEKFKEEERERVQRENQMKELRRKDEEKRRHEEEIRKRYEEEKRKNEEEERRRKQEEEKKKQEQEKKEQERRRTLELINQHDYQTPNHSNGIQERDNASQRLPAKDPFVEEEERRKKNDLLAKLRAIDDRKKDEEKRVSASSPNRKEYNFSEPVINLHQGLPAHGKRKSSIFEDEKFTFGNYRPSFVLDEPKTAKVKDSRTDQFADLFADSKRPAGKVSNDALHDSSFVLDLGASSGTTKMNQGQLHREKQSVPVFRKTANDIIISDDEIEEIEELAI